MEKYTGGVGIQDRRRENWKTRARSMKLQLYNALVPNLKTFLNDKEKLLSKRFSDLNTACTVFGLQAS